MMKIRFLSLANREVDDAVRWYEAREKKTSVVNSLMNWIASFGS